MGRRRNSLHMACGGALLVVLFVADLLTGSTSIAAGDIWKALFGKAPDALTGSIVTGIRLPKALTALFSGIAVSVSGLLMQTMFRNPLAGPYVLGVSSGASLGAAAFVLGFGPVSLLGGSVVNSLGIAGAAWLGSAAVLVLIAFASRKIKDIMVILILGMMLGSGIDALVQIMQYLSDETSLKSYVIWTMGSLGNVTGMQTGLLAAAVAAGLGIAAACIKPLNLLMLGEQYASTSGLDIRRTRNLIFLATVLLSGTVTAFCGPLGFLGLAVPHLTRFIVRDADHRVLLPGTALCGGSLMLVCDMIAKTSALPVNAITSLMGIPVIIYVVTKNRRLV